MSYNSCNDKTIRNEVGEEYKNPYVGDIICFPVIFTCFLSQCFSKQSEYSLFPFRARIVLFWHTLTPSTDLHNKLQAIYCFYVKNNTHS